MLVEILNPSAQIQPATKGFQPAAGILAPRKNFSQHHSSFEAVIAQSTLELKQKRFETNVQSLTFLKSTSKAQ